MSNDGEVGRGMSANLPSLSKQYLVAKMPRPRRRISIHQASRISEDGPGDVFARWVFMARMDSSQI